MAATTQARTVYIDQGEHIDVVQILGQGGIINSGQTWNNLFYGQGTAQDNITAHAGGGQANAVAITGPYMRITIAASAGDSVVLPPSIRGMEITVVNDAAANAVNVFPASAAQGGVSGGDAINALGANTAFSLTVAAGPTIFYCFSNGLWRTK